MESRSANAAAVTSPIDPDLAIIVFGLDEAGKPHGSAFTAADADLAEKAARLMGMRAMPVSVGERQLVAAGLPRGRVFSSGKAFVPFVRKGVFDRLVVLAGPPEEVGNDVRQPDKAAARKAAGGANGDPATRVDEPPANEGAKAAERAPGASREDTDAAAMPASDGTGARPAAGAAAGASPVPEPDASTANKPKKAASKKARKGKPQVERVQLLPNDFNDIKLGSTVLAPEWDHQNWWPAIVRGTNDGGELLLLWRDFPDEPVFTRPLDDLALLNSAYVRKD